MRPLPSVAELVAGVRIGDRVLLARTITLVESNHPAHRATAQEVLQALLPATGGSQRVGISGVPGAGKSTFIGVLGARLVDAGRRVAVLAVDPTSSVTRGSILGDKTRMTDLAASERAFIRPSPASGSLGGVGRTTRETLLVCEAAGFDVILVETVGVGQSETTVADMVDFFVLLELAGAGDELQGIKRGILELADLIVVNKADGPNRRAAEMAAAELERALGILRPDTPSRPRPRVVACSAADGRGVDEAWQLVEAGLAARAASGRLAERRQQQLIRWMWALVEEGLVAAVHTHAATHPALARLEEEILAGRATPTAAADAILRSFAAASPEP